jgi:short-subunit dehydrogenase
MAQNKETVLVTGASSGIGYEMAKLFAKDKAELVIVARNEENLNAVADELRGLGASKVTIIAADLSMPGAADDIYETTKRQSIRITTLVNDAGVGEHGAFSETDLEKEDRIIQLNIVSLVHLTKFYLQEMLRNNSGRILNVASVAAYQPTPTLAIYSATKAFVLSFTDSLIYELKDTDIKVTALIPGPTDTDFFNKAHMENTKAAQDNPQDPAEVAKAGYEGLLKGTHHVTPSLKVQAEVAMSSAMPNEMVSARASKLMKEEKQSRKKN